MTEREVRFAEAAADELVRLFGFLAEKDVQLAERALVAIRRALELAAYQPWSCRKAGHGSSLRECVIQFGRSGYVAAFEIAEDHLLVLAVRHQREEDFH